MKGTDLFFYTVLECLEESILTFWSLWICLSFFLTILAFIFCQLLSSRTLIIFICKDELALTLPKTINDQMCHVFRTMRFKGWFALGLLFDIVQTQSIVCFWLPFIFLLLIKEEHLAKRLFNFFFQINFEVAFTIILILFHLFLVHNRAFNW